MQNCIPIALVLVAATAAGTAMGASPGAAKPPAPSAATTTDRPELTPASLRTDGLHFGDDLTRIFEGVFARGGPGQAAPPGFLAGAEDEIDRLFQ